MNQIDSIILRFFQKKANAEDLKQLDNWSELPANQKDLKDYSKIWLWTRQLKESKPEVAFEDTWYKIIHQSRAQGRSIVLLRNFARYAAIVLVVLNLGWWAARYYYQDENKPVISSLDVTADNASNSVIVLPDNTLVYLRQGSNLHYNDDFGTENREVSLEGEAYFEVTSDKAHPFLVNTENAKIKVLGTKFNVSAEKGSSVCQTTLVEGKVEFITNAGKHYMLLPNQMIELDTKLQKVNIKSVNTELYTAWKDGKIIFRDETLGEIATKLERIYQVKFVFQRPELRNSYRFSGTFHHETPIGDVIIMLKKSIPMDVSRVERFPNPDTIYLK